MTERISAQVALIAAASPTDAPVGPRDVIWIETAQPVYHDLDVTWQADGKAIPAANGSRYLNLATLGSAKPSTVTVTVTDPTEFVRDPEIKTRALTTTRTWKIGGAASRPAPSTWPLPRRLRPSGRSAGATSSPSSRRIHAIAFSTWCGG